MRVEQLRQRLQLFLGAMSSAVASKKELIRGRLLSKRRRHVIISILSVGLGCGALLALFSGLSDTGGAVSTTAQLPIPAPVSRPNGDGRKSDGLSVPAFEPSSYAGIPVAPGGKPLVRAPVPLLTEFKNGLQLPRVSESGQQVWKVYGKPYDTSDPRPKIVIAIPEFGLSSIASQAVIDLLPSAVTFVSSPYADNVDYWISQARADGHEVFVSLPLQATDPGVADAGPKALLTSSPVEETVARLEAVLGTCLGCPGVMISGSDRLLQKAATFSSVLNGVNRRGLMLFAASPGQPGSIILKADEIGLARAWANIVLDEDTAEGHLDERLVELQEIARRRGVAVGIARPLPATLRRLSTWWRSLESKSFVLAPLTAAANVQDAGL